MYTVPRLSPSRRAPGSCPLLACPMPSLRRVHHRTCCRTSGQRCHRSCQAEFRAASEQRTSREQLPNNMAHHCLGSRRQCHPFPPRHKHHGVYNDPSSSHRHRFGSTRYHRLAQDLFLRFHKSRPTPCSSKTRLYILHSRALCSLSLSEKHYPEQLILLLVGTNLSLSARLSSHLFRPLVLHCQAPCRSFQSQYFHLARKRPYVHF